MRVSQRFFISPSSLIIDEKNWQSSSWLIAPWIVFASYQWLVWSVWWSPPWTLPGCYSSHSPLAYNVARCTYHLLCDADRTHARLSLATWPRSQSLPGSAVRYLVRWIWPWMRCRCIQECTGTLVRSRLQRRRWWFRCCFSMQGLQLTTSTALEQILSSLAEFALIVERIYCMSQPI